MPDRPESHSRDFVPLPYYRWYVRHFRSSRAVQAMDYIQRGLYRDLLDEQWESGGLPMRVRDLADICRCPVDVMRSAWDVLRKQFTLVNGRYVNERLESERTDKDKVRARNRLNGRKGGKTKARNARLAQTGEYLASAKRAPYSSNQSKELTDAEAVAVGAPARAEGPMGGGVSQVMALVREQHPELVPVDQRRKPA